MASSTTVRADRSQEDAPLEGHRTERREQRQQPPRKRARMACTWCRDRKVRCDVSIHGQPCTNCRLDRHECALQQSVSRGRAAEIARLHKPASRANPIDRLPKIAISQKNDRSPQNSSSSMWKEGGIDVYNWDISSSHGCPQSAISSFNKSQSSTNVIFSFYSFLKLPNISNLPPEDVRFLEMKGCLHVPPRPILDEFVRQYFLHVHPCLPVINEADLWRVYRGGMDETGTENRISLFTFQAMLFVSSAFVPSKAIKMAGFEDARAARNSLYYRAKLLFDLNSENDVLAKAQGAVLLTYQSSSTELHAGSIWLTVAIQNAIVYGAHVYGKEGKLERKDAHENTKKRLWWSILLRDRILPLGLRRHLQITPQNFNLSLDRMTEEDLEDEFLHSEVYDPETKRLLVRVLQVQCELAMVLTNVIMLVYAPNGLGQPRTMSETMFSQTLKEVEDHKASLMRWSNDAKSALGSILNSDKVHESVTLYTGLTFLYYQAARLALSHFQAFTLETHHMYIGSSHERLLKLIREDIESATSCITDSVKGFLSQGVAHHLPISAVAYTAFPLLLNALDVKLSSSKSQSATRQRRFRYYAEVMQLYRDRYDGTDGVALFIQRALRFADTLNLAITFRETHAGQKQIESNGWSEVFARAPRSYLRLSLALDYAFSRGYFPADAELSFIVCDPFFGTHIPASLSSRPIAGTITSAESGAAEPVYETSDDQGLGEEQLEQPVPLSQAQAASIPLSSAEPLDTFVVDMMKANNSPQETALSSQLQATRQTPQASHDQDLRDECLDFLDFGTPRPRSNPCSSNMQQGRAYANEQFNTMDINTFIELGNDMVEACSSVAPLNPAQEQRYSADNLNTMGVHTMMDFGEEMPLWSDHMLNEILSPISNNSGA